MYGNAMLANQIAGGIQKVLKKSGAQEIIWFCALDAQIVTKYFLVSSDNVGERKGTPLCISQVGKKEEYCVAEGQPLAVTRVVSTLKKATECEMGASDYLSKELEQIC